MPKISKEEDLIISKIFNKATQDELIIVKSMINDIKNRKGIYQYIAKNGQDLHTSKNFISEKTGLRDKTSASLARELWFLVNSALEVEKRLKVGIKEGVWIYESFLCNYESHARFNNKKFNLKKGIKDGLFSRVHAGHLVGCRCMVRPIMPGLDN